MSQGGSRRPYSRWHPRYKDYWDYEQNYSSAGSPKEACVAQSPPPVPAKRHQHHHHPHHEQRRLSVAGTSTETPHVHHHLNLDTNPLEGPVESMVSGAGSSDGELSSKAGDSPSRKRRRICRHLSSGESNVSVTAPAAERRPPRHQYHARRRVRYISGGGNVCTHQRILEHTQHPAHPHPAHQHPVHQHPVHQHPVHQHPVHQHPVHQHQVHQHPAHQHPSHPHQTHPHPAHIPHPAPCLCAAHGLTRWEQAWVGTRTHMRTRIHTHTGSTRNAHSRWRVLLALSCGPPYYLRCRIHFAISSYVFGVRFNIN
ncbi:unnamed protein product [Leptidea sinapis]|uniref:Uncharacterized protein n=1 Tax=Leptidea sinapis TaxID=189913 RepID=A0A5E4R0W2_9NEOP|nr:unnamed protein product [Leptidea sinapis]